MSAHALGVRRCDIIKHHIQARVAAYNDIVGLNAEQLGKQHLCFGDAVQQTVVAGIKSRLRQIHILGRQAFQHRERQVELLRARLTAGHIQSQVLCLILFVAALQLLQTRRQLFVCGRFQIPFHTRVTS